VVTPDETIAALREAIRDAIRLGYEGESIAGIELLIERFPDIADSIT